MKQYEYKVLKYIYLPHQDIEDDLNHLGKYGWIVVTQSQSSDQFGITLMREVFNRDLSIKGV